MRPANPARQSSESAAHHMEVVTPHDTNEVSDYYPRGIHVGGAGNITGRLVGDTADITITNVQVGFYPWAFKIIKATGTTATSMVIFR